MKWLVSLVLLLATAFAEEEPVPILSQDSEVGVDGSYHSKFESGNGIMFSEEGVLKNAGQKDVEAEEVHGTYSYTGPDGKVYTVNYVANENGFQPHGEHFPVAPEIPLAIVRALEYNEQHPEEFKTENIH